MFQKLKSGAHSVHAPNASSLKDLQQVERHIRATMSLLHAHLQLKEKQLLHSLACFGNGTKKLTSDMMADIQAHIKSVNMLLQNAQTVIASPTMYCLDVDKLLSRLKSVPDNTPCHIVTSPVSTTAKPKLKIDVDNIKTALNQIDLEIPQNVSPLSLVSTADLPPDYNIPPIAPAMKTSDPKMVLSRPPSSMSVRSDVTNKSDTNSLADNPSTSSAVTIIKDFGSETSAPKSIIPCMPEEVVVVHVDTPGDFYVQRKTAQIDLKKIDFFIDPFHVEKQRPVSRVNLDDIYLAKFAADGKWYRVRVTQIPPPGSPPDAPLTLLYIDWGNGDQQPLCRLRPCPGRIKSIPALAIHCAMYDCVPVHSRAWSPESIKYFVSIILKEDDESSVSMQVYTILPNNNQYCVDLHVLGEYGTVSVRSTLLALNYARQYKSGSSSVSSVDSRHDPVPLTKTNSAETLSVIPEPGLPKHTLVDVRVSYVESPAYFCVQKANNMSAIYRLSSELQQHYGDTHSLASAVTAPDIVIGRIVACKVDDKWYRGFITEKIVEETESPLDPNILLEEVRQVRVYCIDYGYKVLLSVGDILKLHPKFFSIPAQALKCSLFGITPMRPHTSVEPSEGEKAEPMNQDTNAAASDEAKPNLPADRGEPADTVPKEDTVDSGSSSKSAVKPNMEAVKKIPPSWPDNIASVLNNLLGVSETEQPPFSLCVSNQDNPSSGVQKVILYKREGGKEECMNKKLVDMKLAKAASPRISTARTKNIDKSSVGAQKKTANVQPEKIKKQKFVKKMKTPTKAEFGRTGSSSSDSDNVSDLEYDEEDQTETDELRANYKQVAVSYVQDPYHVYVTLFSRQKKLQDLSDAIQNHYNVLPPCDVPIEWKVTDRCIAYSNTKSMYARGVIKDITDDKAKVYFIDIGNEELVPLPNLKPIEPEFTQEMDGVIACRLSGIVCADSEDAQVWPDYVVDRLREFVENNRGCLYIYKSGPLKDHVLPIHLWIKKLKVAGPFSPSVTTWICVNRLLISEACAHPTEQEEFTGKHFESPFTSDTLGNTDAAQLISSKLNTRKSKTLPSCGVGSGVRPELAYPVAIHSAEVKDWLPAEPLASLELEIKPTYVDYHCRVYFVDPTKLDINSEIQTVLSAKYKLSSPRDSDLHWSLNQVCTVRYHLDMGWYRGKIVSIWDGIGARLFRYDSDLYWSLNQVCTVRYHLDMGWYRGKIVSLEDEEGKYGVYFVDYGNTESCTPTELRKEACYHDVPVLCSSCMFHGLEPVQPEGEEHKTAWPIPTLDILHKLIVDQLLKVTLMPPLAPGGPYLVKEMKLAKDGEDIIEVLLTNNLVRRTSSKRNQKSKGKTPVQPKPGSSQQEPITVEADECNDEVPDLDLSSLKGISWYEASEIEALCRAALNYEFPRLPIKLKPGSILKVNVQYIASLSPVVSIFVTLVEPYNEELKRIVAQFTSLDAEIQREASSQPLLRVPGPGMRCIAGVQDEDDGNVTWHRACVLGVKEDWTNVPVQALSCVLHGVDLACDVDDNAVMQELIHTISNHDEPTFMKVVKSSHKGSPLVVEIFEDPETTVLLYQPLVDSGSFIMESEVD
ncbi:hypothetical protein M8J76_007425 [Diaphorina citri]|nr:hypothetical protein M8J76_007425 [Diaphorina citri]